MQLTETELAEKVSALVAKALEKRLDAIPAVSTPLERLREASAARLEPQVAKHERGLNLARFILSMGAAKLEAKTGGHRPESAVEWASKRWGENHPVVHALAVTSSTVSGGGSFVPEMFSSEMIEFLRATAVVRRMNPQTLGMVGTLRVPRINAGATASYKGEGAPPNATQPTTGDIILTAKKLIGIMPFSNDWLRRSVPGAEEMFRTDLVDALATREDLAFIRGDGLSDTPKGLRNLMAAANAVASSGTFDVPTTRKELSQLENKLMSADVKMRRPGWLFAARTFTGLKSLLTTNGVAAFPELAQGQLMGYPFAVTTQIPINLGGGGNESEVYLADFAEVVVGDELNMLVDVFNEGSYLDSAGATQSLVSNDETAVRIISEHDIALRHDTAVAVLTAVTWTA